MTPIDITVAVCTFNRAALLREALQSLVCQQTGGKFRYEVLVVDNHSSDETGSVVEEVSAGAPVPVRYVLETQRGIAPARNRGVREALGRWIAVFDDDQLAEPDWLARLYEAARITTAECVGGATRLIIPEHERSALHPECRGMLSETPPADTLRRYSARRYPSDSNVLRSRRVHEVVGPFDTHMERGGQDEDFSRRAAAAGFAMWQAPEAVVHHRVTPQMLAPEYFRWHARRAAANYAYLERKHRGTPGVLAACAARIAKAVLWDLPRWAGARIRRNPRDRLRYACRLWRAESYIRSTLAMAAPRRFRQQRFFDQLNFRYGRRGAGQRRLETAHETGALG